MTLAPRGTQAAGRAVQAARAAARRRGRGRRMFKKLFRKSTGSSGSAGSPGKDDAASPAGKEPLAGIGIIFQLAPDGGLYIKSMPPDGAAHESGILQQGDCLMSVDGVNVFGKSADYVTSKIMGKVGSPVATKFRYCAVFRRRAVQLCTTRGIAHVRAQGAVRSAVLGLNHH